jgi:translocator protein
MANQFFRPSDGTAIPGARSVAVHLAVIAGVLAVGIALGTTVRPGDWYDTLQKPWFTPPPWAFGPIWTVLYVLIGWAGARKLLYGGARGLWVGQMALNWLWTPVFFGLHWTGAGLVVILAMLALILAFIAAEWSRDRVSALMFVPYAVWVTLASAVNAGVVWLN